MNIYIIGNIDGDLGKNNGLKTRMDNNLYNFYVYLQNNSKYKINILDNTKKQKNILLKIIIIIILLLF